MPDRRTYAEMQTPTRNRIQRSWKRAPHVSRIDRTLAFPDPPRCAISDPSRKPFIGLDGLPEEFREEVRVRLPGVYDELRQCAQRCIDQLPPGQSVAPTDLVHETYIKLTGNPELEWADDRHFVCAASLAMRQIAIDRIRRRSTQKRGGGHGRVDLNDQLALPPDSNELLALEVDELLSELERESPRGAQVVTMRFFVGMTEAQVASALGISARTVRRDWVHAKAWLARAIARRGSARETLDSDR